MVIIAIPFLLGCIALAAWAVKGTENESPDNCKINPYAEPKSPNSAYSIIEERRKAEQKRKEQEEKERQERILKEKSEKLNESIKKAMKEETHPSIKQLLKTMLETEVVDDVSYEEKKWLFNNGKLRILSEIEQHEHELKEKYYHDHPEAFDSECKKVNAAACWLPFIFGFLLCLGQCTQSNGGSINGAEAIFIIPLCLIVALIFGLIGMGFGHKANLEKAKQYNINNERTAYERRELGLCKVAGIASAVDIMHHAKNTVKDIANVDSWKEMK